VANALEDGIIKATEYLAEEMDNIPLPTEDELSSNLTMLTVNNVSFSQKSEILKLINSDAVVNKAELSKFADNTAVYSVRHSGSTDNLATEIDKKYGAQYEITGVKSGRITMQTKE
jgi:hypothetical protein